MISASEIRKKFLDYFQNHEHNIVRSSSLVPSNDPSLMFTNAGMVQFKNIFTGLESPKFPRAASSQKCVRAGGKHNDLENVGYTARHHTFFEMLGNFSFGDYFKEKAIFYSWELLNRDFGLPKDKLYVTVYHTDDEAYNLWKKIANLSDDRIIRIKTDDNFWSMGELGPCGPCTEIFYDHGDKIKGGLPGSPDQDGDRYIEIWNIVFMQYEKLASGQRIDLPKPSIDTGMGLERISAVLQGVHDNYEIDLFKKLIAHSCDYTSSFNQGEQAFSHRVIADHIRSIAFLIADGVMPSNDGRGYVLRRIMRRAMRHVHFLGAKDITLYKMVKPLNELMGQQYPELGRAFELTIDILKLEEERFKDTLERGLKLLDSEIVNLKSGDVLNGEVVFKLYDTYGFPSDLTEDILKGKKITIDHSGFDHQMNLQKEMARNASKGSGDKVIEGLWFDLHNKYGKTEFLGYNTPRSSARILAIIAQDGELNEISKIGHEFSFITNQTPFYGEGGGQMGDRGIASGDHNLQIEIYDTKKYFGELYVHFARLKSGKLKAGDSVELIIDLENRVKLKANHSATHLLHSVLRKYLGSHVVQKGSLVAPDRLRFDFSHPKALTSQEISDIEFSVNELISENSETKTRLMDIDKAMESGALALFGEKYDEEVRVVYMGTSDDDHDHAYSVELCGGTHVERLGNIGFFKIVSQSSIAAGIRRLEAITGKEALSFVNERLSVLSAVQDLMKAKAEEVVTKISSLIEEKKKLEKQIKSGHKNQTGNNNFLSETIGKIQFFYQLSENTEVKSCRDELLQMIKNKEQTIVCVIIEKDDKSSIILGLSQDLVGQFNATQLIEPAIAILGGTRGGGKPEIAQGGGVKIGVSNQAFSIIKEAISS